MHPGRFRVGGDVLPPSAHDQVIDKGTGTRGPKVVGNLPEDTRLILPFHCLGNGINTLLHLSSERCCFLILACDLTDEFDTLQDSGHVRRGNYYYSQTQLFKCGYNLADVEVSHQNQVGIQFHNFLGIHVGEAAYLGFIKRFEREVAELSDTDDAVA